MIIYIVTCGDYSDYSIRGVFADKALAKRCVELGTDSWGTPEIEEWEADKLDDPHPGLLPYQVLMTREGAAEVERETSTCAAVRPWEPYGNGKQVSFSIFAKDKAHAVKVAGERRAQLIASGEWTTDWDEWRKREK